MMKRFLFILFLFISLTGAGQIVRPAFPGQKLGGYTFVSNKATGDTTYYFFTVSGDTFYVSNTSSLVLIPALQIDTSQIKNYHSAIGPVIWSDTISIIATKWDIDTVYDHAIQYEQDSSQILFWSDTLGNIATDYYVDSSLVYKLNVSDSLWANRPDYLEPSDLTKGIGSDSGYWQNGDRIIFSNNGTSNIQVGGTSLNPIKYGASNVLIGHEVMTETDSIGNDNIFIGYLSGYRGAGTGNTFIGSRTSQFSSGNYNTILGFNSFSWNQTGSNNLFLGANSGYNFLGSNTLIIHNWGSYTPTEQEDTTQSLIYGNFLEQRLNFNGRIIISKYLNSATDCLDSAYISKIISCSSLYLKSSGNIQMEADTGKVIGKFYVSNSITCDTIKIKYLKEGPSKIINVVDTIKAQSLIWTSANGSVSKPAFGWSDGYGMYRGTTDIDFIIGGARKIRVATNTTDFGSTTSSYASVSHTVTSSTQPCFRTAGQTTTGIGFETSNSINLITNNKTRQRTSDNITTFPTDVDIDSTLNVDGNTTVKKIYLDSMFYAPPHSDVSFEDSAVVITGSASYQQITNVSDSLFNYNELNGMTYLGGDTIVIKYKGGYNIIGVIAGYGNNGADWTCKWARKRGATVTYGKASIQFTTTGASNKNGGSSVGYVECEPGDKLYMTLKRDSGTGDFTITTGKFSPQLYYRTQ